MHNKYIRFPVEVEPSPTKIDYSLLQSKDKPIDDRAASGLETVDTMGKYLISRGLCSG